MFFILEEKYKPSIVRNESKKVSYAVLDVIRADVSISITSLDSDSSSESSDNSSIEEERNCVSIRMVEQFLERAGLKDDFSPKWTILEQCPQTDRS
jgi:hypothetical protein